MSGGFFRGTSADQDTRFSNKMSKLLKSQKFAPELDVLVEMAKVKIDVIKPWIATRVTELLGFEDEVLINFIYGLLDVKEADGKHLQIQLTGFMEKNTGRFMKELWSLLTSAQNTMSGIPQQFLDAKAEEAKKRKDEKDRILSEVLRKKEEQEKDAEEERQRRLSTRDESAKVNSEKRGTSNSPNKRTDGKSSEGLGSAGGRNGRTVRKTSLSPRSSASRSSSPSRVSPPVRHRRPRSISRSPRRRRRSGSPFRRRSPLPRRSPLRSPPRRRRSPFYSRSPPRRRKSPPVRTPPRLRSRSPPRNTRRSPVSSPRRHLNVPRSPPLRRRPPSGSLSPVFRRSPSRSPYVRRRSVSRDRVLHRSRSLPRRSRSPLRRSRSPLRRSRSPHRRRRSLSRDKEVQHSRSPYQRKRSASRELGGQVVRSPHRYRRSLSRERGVRRNGVDARDRDRTAREAERSEKKPEHQEKRELPDQHGQLSREHDRVVSKEGNDNLLSGSHMVGEKRSHVELEEEEGLEPEKSDRSNYRDIELMRASRKVSRGPQRPGDITFVSNDEVKRTGDKNERLVALAAESDDEDAEATRPPIALKSAKDVSDVGLQDGSESPGSSEETREAKRRRKEEKRLKKEEKRKRREEKHKRREEKRAAKHARAREGVNEDGEDPEDRPRRADVKRHGSKEAFSPGEVYRSKDEETEDEQKRIERELRHKALESLRAKKGIAC